MTRLEQDVDIAHVLSLFEAHGRQGGRRELAAVLGYVALMEKQLVAVREELRGVREELAGLRQPGPAATERQKLAERLDESVQVARQKLDEVKQGIIQWAKDTASAVKQAGAAALDGAARALHVRQGLQAMSVGMKHAAGDVGSAAARVAAINLRQRKAGRHLRNFGRALRGRAPLARMRPEGKLSQGVQSFFADVGGVLAGVARDADAAVARLDKLEQVARPKRNPMRPCGRKLPRPACNGNIRGGGHGIPCPPSFPTGGEKLCSKTRNLRPVPKKRTV